MCDQDVTLSNRLSKEGSRYLTFKAGRQIPGQEQQLKEVDKVLKLPP
jgi:hypothetical protein